MENSILNKYLDEIGHEKILSDDEERSLCEKIKQGDAKAMNRLVEANLRFVVSVARQYQGQGVDMEDLVSEGNIGLMAAARTYDATRGGRFVKFAVVHIRRQIEWAIKGQTISFEPEYGRRTRSIDAPLGAKNNMSLLSVITDANALQADDIVHNAAVEEVVGKVLGILNERERTVISAYYGDGITMAEIGIKMGLKRERVRQIRNRAIRRLRNEFKKKYNFGKDFA